LRERFRKPGLSADAFRRWAWLGGPGPFWRTASVALAALVGPWGILAAAVIGAGALPAALAFWALTYAPPLAPIPRVMATALGALAFVFGLVELFGRQRMIERAHRQANRGWGAPSRGGYWGHLFFVVVVRLFGPKPAYLVLYPITLYFLFAAPKNRRASMQYLDRVLGPARGLARWTRSYRHFLAFARVMVDRLVLGAAGRDAFKLEEKNLHFIIDASFQKKGVVLVTAHLGNYDVGAGLLHGRLGAPLAIVAFQNDVAHLRQLVERHTGTHARVLAVGTAELAALDILHALRDGEVVAMQGNRTIDDRVAWAPFLGKDAPFPVGPFLLAAMSGAPLITTFNVQVGPRSYAFVADTPRHYQFERGRPRDDQLKGWVAHYARRLEELVRQHPFQWFNFYDFWAAPKQ
jgi:predicted LPLAT superfamily acyltransferase